MDKHFLIEFDYFDPTLKDFLDYEERQNRIIEAFKNTNRVISLSVSEEESIIWVVMKAESETELVYLMDSLSLPENTEYDYFELNMHLSISTFESYSLN